MGYTIVSADDIPSMNRIVNEFIEDGWAPTGGVAYTEDVGLVQAMTRHLAVASTKLAESDRIAVIDNVTENLDDILDNTLVERGTEKQTLRCYLISLAQKCWEEGESFSGKRPFGSSGWHAEVYKALAKRGLIVVYRNSEGEWTDFDEVHGNKIIEVCFNYLKESK